MMDKSTKNKILVLFSALSLLMGVVCNMAIPVSAAPSIDATSTTFSSFYYYTGQNSYSMTDASTSNEIKIPLYCMYFGPNSPDESYLNGFIRTPLPGYTFSFNGSSIAPSYFEVDPAPGLSCSSPTANSNSMTIYFDNHLKQINFYFILGYYVFNFSEYTTLSITVNPGAGLVQRDPSVTALYSSTSEFGLAQAIVTAIDNSSDIDSIISVLNNLDSTTLQSVISGISSNTTLLTQIYQRLGQMQTANQTFYNNIDSYIDTISWVNDYNDIGWSTTYDGTLDYSIGSRPFNVSDTIYFKLCSYNNHNLSLYYIFFPYDIVNGYNYDLFDFEDYFKIEFVNGFNNRNIDLDYTTFRVGGGYYIFLDFATFPYHSGSSVYLKITRLKPNYMLYKYFKGFSKYITSDDIEYWNILDTIKTIQLYNLLYSYINADVSSPVDSAATQAAGLAHGQAAAEASLAALSPADMGDFDSAVSDITILDDVSNSLVFWTNAVHAFSTRSGSLWGVFIFGLLIGLIAFILRLRR